MKIPQVIFVKTGFLNPSCGNPTLGVICKEGEVRTTKHVVAKAYHFKQYKIGNGGKGIPCIFSAVNRKAIVH